MARIGMAGGSAALAALALALAAAGARAQLPTDLPSSALPNRAPPGQEAPTPFLLDFDLAIDAPAGVRPPPEIAEEVVTVTQIRIEGMTVYTREQMLPYFEAVIGEDITFDRLYDIAGDVTARYRADGYALSFAFFPPQVVENGVYTLQVVEGFVDDVAIEGVEGWLADWLRQEAQEVRWVRPFRLGQLEALVQRLNGLSGARIQSILQPSEDRERASTVTLEVTYNLYSFEAETNNQGSQFVGPWAHQGTVTARNAVGFGEEIALDTTVTSELEEQQSASITYTQPIGGFDSALRFLGSVSKTEPGFTIRDSAITSRTYFGRVTYERTFFPSLRRTATGFVSIDYLNNRTYYNDGANDGDQLNADRLWTLKIGGSIQDEDCFGLGGYCAILGEIAQGVPGIPGSTVGEADPDDEPNAQPSRADARPENTTFTASLWVRQPLALIDRRLALGLRAEGAYNRKAAFASQEYTTGGSSFGRGYDPSEISGDAGFSTAVELTYDIQREAWNRGWLLVDLTPYVFWDFGYAYNYNQSLGGKATLASAGGGLTMRTRDRSAQFDIEFAQPLTRRVGSAPDQSEGLPFRVYVSGRFNTDFLAGEWRDLASGLFSE